MTHHVDERALVDRILSGDGRAFEELVRDYEKLVQHVVLPFLRSHTDRQDMCQDVFMKVYEHMHTFQFKSKLSTWIGNIAYNTALNAIARRKHVAYAGTDAKTTTNASEPKEDIEGLPDTVPSADELLVAKERTRLLTWAINQLPAIPKSVVLLFHRDELTLEEISLILELPVNTIKSHLFRSRRRLKDILLQYGGD